MPRNRGQGEDRAADLLQKLLVLQLYSLGTSQDKIARVVGRQKLWVNDLLKGIPKRASENGPSKKKKY
jgi:hypothetical protein